MKEMLKTLGVRMVFSKTEGNITTLSKENIYWDGSFWRLAGNLEAEGVRVTEEYAEELLEKNTNDEDAWHLRDIARREIEDGWRE